MLVNVQHVLYALDEERIKFQDLKSML